MVQSPANNDNMYVFSGHAVNPETLLLSRIPVPGGFLFHVGVGGIFCCSFSWMDLLGYFFNIEICNYPLASFISPRSLIRSCRRNSFSACVLSILFSISLFFVHRHLITSRIHPFLSHSPSFVLRIHLLVQVDFFHIH